MNTKMVEFVKHPGFLLVQLTHEGFSRVEEIREAREKHGIDAALLDVCEYQLCNGWEVLSDDDKAAVGALTGCNFIVSDDVRRDDQGKVLHIGAVYWNPNYAVMDEIEVLCATGQIILQEVK
jgi:hypothetical protein